MAGFNKSIPAKCRKCGKSAPSDQFVLDHVDKMMVCPSCVKERRGTEIIHKELEKQRVARKAQVEEKAKKPVGWDADDDILERNYKKKQSEYIDVERVDANKIKYSCPKCSYNFVIDEIKERPNKCPYCARPVGKYRSLSSSVYDV